MVLKMMGERSALQVLRIVTGLPISELEPCIVCKGVYASYKESRITYRLDYVYTYSVLKHKMLAVSVFLVSPEPDSWILVDSQVKSEEGYRFRISLEQDTGYYVVTEKEGLLPVKFIF